MTIQPMKAIAYIGFCPVITPQIKTPPGTVSGQVRRGANSCCLMAIGFQLVNAD